MANENYYANRSIDDRFNLWLPVCTENMRSIKGRAYQVLLACPEGQPPAGGWPVAYVLDHSLFHALVKGLENHQRLSLNTSERGWCGIVVGIGYSGIDERNYDYTPLISADLAAIVEPVQGSGGADDFLDFLLQELMPWVASSYPVAARRSSLAGHSLGGLFALHALFQHSAGFQHYIVSSPSVWWGGNYLARAAQHFVQQAEHKPLNTPVRVAITVGEYEQSLSPAEQRREPDYQEQQLTRRTQRRMLDGGRELAGSLQPVAGLDLSFLVLPGLTHAMAGPQALLSQWPLIFPGKT